MSARGSMGAGGEGSSGQLVSALSVTSQTSSGVTLLHDREIGRVAVRLARIIHALQQATSDSTTLLAIQALLVVAREEGERVSDVATALGRPASTTSRLLMDLGPRNRKLEPGFALVEPSPDPIDYRVTRYALTPLGRSLLEEIAPLLRGGAAKEKGQ